VHGEGFSGAPPATLCSWWCFRSAAAPRILQVRVERSVTEGQSDRENNTQITAAKDRCVGTANESSAARQPSGSTQRFARLTCLRPPKPLRLRSSLNFRSRKRAWEILCNDRSDRDPLAGAFDRASARWNRVDLLDCAVAASIVELLCHDQPNACAIN